nr:trypsin-like peptidase domain-containing protein [Ralstonia sp. UBA689]
MASVLGGVSYLQPTAIAAGIAPAPAKGASIAPVDLPTIVERYGPAVVNISATAPEQPTQGQAPEDLDPDDPFIQIFQRSAPQFRQPQSGAPHAIRGTGSGFIVSPDGLILTSAHVVDRAEEVTVKLTDRREFKAKVLAVDPRSDVAVIRIDAKKLPTVKLGDSSRVRAGELVLMIGSPHGPENTVTAGIVSVAPRALPEGVSTPFIQTDVNIVTDNSGGPLLNRSGEVIGINVQIYGQTEGGYSGLTFAIPINVAVQVEKQLLALRKVPQGNLGIGMQDVDPGLARAFGLPRPAGALVNSVEPGSPAAASGLKPGDVITQIGDKAVDRSAELAEHLAALKPGTKIALTLIRNQKPMTATIVAAASEGRPGTQQDEGSAAHRLGLAVRPLNEAERLATALTEGLAVDAVEEPAASAGIQPGDIVLSFNGTPVKSPEQMSALTAKAGKQVALLILHNNARIFVSVELR